jgi:hypothetical protein
MQKTLSKIKKLEKFIRKHGEEPFISQTISKMVVYRISKYNEEIKKLNKEIKKIERIYNKDSSVFFKEFNEGKLEDNINFIEWASLYQMRNRLLDKRTDLESSK